MATDTSNCQSGGRQPRWGGSSHTTWGAGGGVRPCNLRAAHQLKTWDIYFASPGDSSFRLQRFRFLGGPPLFVVLLSSALVLSIFPATFQPPAQPHKAAKKSCSSAWLYIFAAPARRAISYPALIVSQSAPRLRNFPSDSRSTHLTRTHIRSQPWQAADQAQTRAAAAASSRSLPAEVSPPPL